jgi:hypothetical protein
MPNKNIKSSEFFFWGNFEKINYQIEKKHYFLFLFSYKKVYPSVLKLFAKNCLTHILNLYHLKKVKHSEKNKWPKK